MTAPAHPGLQAERTSLAWRRTAMAVAVGSLIGLKVLPPHLGVSGYIASLLGLLWSADLGLLAVRRYRHADARLRGQVHASDDAGSAVFRTALVAVAAATAALVCVFVIAGH